MAEGARIVSIAFREPPEACSRPGPASARSAPTTSRSTWPTSSKLSLSFYGKRPGPGMVLDKLSLQFALHETEDEEHVLEAYERLILDAMAGDQTLFTSAEGIERLWEVAAPLLENPPAVHPYQPGTWGPAAMHAPHLAPHLAAAVRTPVARTHLSGPAGPPRGLPCEMMPVWTNRHASIWPSC